MFRLTLITSLPFVVATIISPALAQDAPKPNDFPGPTAAGFLLPNGWRVTPAGEQVVLTDLPLNIVTSPDGKHAFVAMAATTRMTAVELATGRRRPSRRASWFGWRAGDGGKREWSRAAMA
jgi:hypothetical protein